MDRNFHMINCKKDKIVFTLLYASVIISVLSQIEVISIVMRPIMYIFWILLFIFCFVLKTNKLYFSKFTIIFVTFYTVYILYCLLCSSFGTSHIRGGYIKLLMIPLLLSGIGDYISDRISSKIIQRLCICYVCVSVIYALWVNAIYFSSYSEWLKRMTYGFRQKNSAAQIWCAAILITFFVIKCRGKWKIVLCVFSGIYLFMITAISQCRTALLALFIVLLGYILLFSKKKAGCLMALCVIGIIAYNIPLTKEFINQALVLNKYAETDLNTFSSGRLELYSEAWDVFVKSPIIGAGNWYVDCSYLCVIAEGGIVAFLLIESIWIYRIFLNIKRAIVYKKFLFFITVFYIVESIFEGYPPFGPGVSSSMFWLLSSIFSNKRTKNVEEIDKLWPV